MSIDVPFLLFCLAVTYVLNVAATRQFTRTRLLHTAPAVAAYATVAYGVVGLLFLPVVAIPFAGWIALRDIHPRTAFTEPIAR